MAHEKVVTAGDRAGGLLPRYEKALLLQRGDQGGTYKHRSPDGTGGALRGRGAEERRLPKE